MNCKESKKAIDLVLDGVADEDTAVQMHMHLSKCPGCQNEYDQLSAVGQIAALSLSAETPSSLDESILEAFRENLSNRAQEDGRTRSTWFGIPRLAFATVLTLFVVTAIMAFQLGRFTAPVTAESSETQSDSSEQEPVDKQRAVSEESKKTKTEYIEVPVVRERLITRTVYRPVRRKRGVRVGKTIPSQPNKIRENQFASQANLKGFQPVPELKPEIIKNGESNDK